MTIKRKELTFAELQTISNGEGSVEWLKELLISWGFDPYREILVFDDPLTYKRVIIQEEMDND